MQVERKGSCLQGYSSGEVTHPFATRVPLQAGAFPFDLHVLSTPPAFILSQDQTLHKKFQKETGREKPKPNQKQTNQHKVLDWQNPKITKVQNQPSTRRGHKQGSAKNIRETCSTTPHAHRTKNDDAIHHWNSTTPPPAHTHRRAPHSAQKAGKHTHATKVHWHTIEFSNNTSTPTNQNQKRSQPEKAASSEATQPTNQKSNSR